VLIHPGIKPTTMTEASKAAFIKGESHRVGVKNHILNYFKMTQRAFTVKDIEKRLWYDFETVKKRISDLELEGKLKIIGTLGGYSFVYLQCTRATIDQNPGLDAGG